MILLIDNYDSFSYNLYQLIGQLDSNIKVIRNDEMTTDEIRKLNPERIVISPGPGKPKDAGVCVKAVKELAAEIPILGVCLGHQSICEAFGATVTYAPCLMHGKTSNIKLSKESRLFAPFFVGNDSTNTIKVARYHSLAVDPKTVPQCLNVTAVTDDGVIMAVEHKQYNVYGLQFHPESVLTPDGKKIIESFLNITK